MTCGALLVRRGQEETLPADEQGRPLHTIPHVYREMLLQCARDYAGLPDPRTLTLSQIRFFYDALRPELLKHTKPSDR